MEHQVSIRAFVQAMDCAGLSDKPTRGWLANYGEPGEGGRKTAGEDRLSYAYDHDHMLDDLGVICTLSGIDSWRVADALEAARRASENTASQAAAFRRLISWSDIEPGARAFAHGKG